MKPGMTSLPRWSATGVPGGKRRQKRRGFAGRDDASGLRWSEGRLRRNAPPARPQLPDRRRTKAVCPVSLCPGLMTSAGIRSHSCPSTRAAFSAWAPKARLLMRSLWANSAHLQALRKRDYLPLASLRPQKRRLKRLGRFARGVRPGAGRRRTARPMGEYGPQHHHDDRSPAGPRASLDRSTTATRGWRAALGCSRSRSRALRRLIDLSGCDWAPLERRRRRPFHRRDLHDRDARRFRGAGGLDRRAT